MPKVTKQKTRTERICPKCHGTINSGEQYIKWTFFRGRPNIRCTKPGCAPKQSELTQNVYYKLVHLIKETITINIQNFEDATVIIDDLVTMIEEVRDEQEDKYENMPEGFKYSERGEELERQVDVLNDACDALTSIEVPGEDEILEKEEELSLHLRGDMDPENKREEHGLSQEEQ